MAKLSHQSGGVDAHEGVAQLIIADLEASFPFRGDTDFSREMRENSESNIDGSTLTLTFDSKLRSSGLLVAKKCGFLRLPSYFSVTVESRSYNK